MPRLPCKRLLLCSAGTSDTPSDSCVVPVLRNDFRINERRCQPSHGLCEPTAQPSQRPLMAWTPALSPWGRVLGPSVDQSPGARALQLAPQLRTDGMLPPHKWSWEGLQTASPRFSADTTAFQRTCNTCREARQPSYEYVRVAQSLSEI